MAPREGLSIMEALENLSTLVETESLDEIEVTDTGNLISHQTGESGDLYWVRAGPDEQTVEAIKETFRVVHTYLQAFYSKMHKEGDQKKLVEGVNTIMVLVGEAAKKLDRFGALFRQRVVEFDEYKKLQNFYHSKVIKESFQEFAAAPLAKEPFEAVEEEAGVHILNDIEVIKQDHLYELFYLRNEGGHPFYTYELARNLKLACDFGQFRQEYFGEDPLLQIKNWEDKGMHLLAERILHSSKKWIGAFFKEARHYRDTELVATLQNALMALMLAANPRNMIRQFSPKGSHLYFHDFQIFLRQVLQNREFQKLLIYSPPESKPFFVALFNLVHSLCFDLFTIGADRHELKEALAQMCGTKKRGQLLSEVLSEAYNAINEKLKKHPRGPVFKALDLVREEAWERAFDPIMQGNLPAPEAVLVRGNREAVLLHTPAPVIQEMIDRAVISDEFKGYLRFYRWHHKHPYLFLNFQDRTSWREHARCLALEDLSRLAEFADSFFVVTLATETDFYNQSGIYRETSSAEDFLAQFVDHLGDLSAGYFIPPALKKKLAPGALKELIGKVHRHFFAGKKQLSHRERLDFIEVTHHLFILKLIDLLDPDVVTLTSKDGLDMGAEMRAGLIATLGIAQGKKWIEEETNNLIALTFGPTLMQRERALDPARFDRLIHLIRLLEAHPDFGKEFKIDRSVDISR